MAEILTKKEQVFTHKQHFQNKLALCVPSSKIAVRLMGIRSSFFVHTHRRGRSEWWAHCRATGSSSCAARMQINIMEGMIEAGGERERKSTQVGGRCCTKVSGRNNVREINIRYVVTGNRRRTYRELKIAIWRERWRRRGDEDCEEDMKRNNGGLDIARDTRRRESWHVQEEQGYWEKSGDIGD